MHTKIVLLTQGQDVRERVDGAEACRAERHDDRTDIARGEALLQGRDVHPAHGIGWYAGKREAEDVGNAAVRVVCLLGRDDAFPWIEATGNPERLEVGHRAATGEMTQRLFPAEHPAQVDDAFLFHRRARAAPVQGVVIRVDIQGERVGQASDRVRGLKHLPGILGMKIRVVVLHAPGHFGEHGGSALRVE